MCKKGGGREGWGGYSRRPVWFRTTAGTAMHSKQAARFSPPDFFSYRPPPFVLLRILTTLNLRDVNSVDLLPPLLWGPRFYVVALVSQKKSRESSGRASAEKVNIVVAFSSFRKSARGGFLGRKIRARLPWRPMKRAPAPPDKPSRQILRRGPILWRPRVPGDGGNKNMSKKKRRRRAAAMESVLRDPNRPANV